MKRILATMGIDFRLQFRNGFYYAAAFVALIMIVLLNQLPEEAVLFLLPILLFENLVINAFYFMAGLVLLEKGEGILEAQIITPLRTREYLVSKVLTLAVLSLVESLVIVGFTYGLGFQWLPLLVGITLLALLFSLTGFLVVARYDSINEFLFPSFLITALLSIPLLTYFGFMDSPLIYLHPFQAQLVLLQAAFQPQETWQLVYGLAYSVLWIGLAFRWSRRDFSRFVIRKEGVRA